MFPTNHGESWTKEQENELHEMYKDMKKLLIEEYSKKYGRTESSIRYKLERLTGR